MITLKHVIKTAKHIESFHLECWKSANEIKDVKMASRLKFCAMDQIEGLQSLLIHSEVIGADKNHPAAMELHAIWRRILNWERK